MTQSAGIDLTTGDIQIRSSSGGGGTPGGSDTQFQYNDGGAFAGCPRFSYAKATGEFTFGDGTNDTIINFNAANDGVMTWDSSIKSFILNRAGDVGWLYPGYDPVLAFGTKGDGSTIVGMQIYCQPGTVGDASELYAFWGGIHDEGAAKGSTGDAVGLFGYNAIWGTSVRTYASLWGMGGVNEISAENLTISELGGGKFCASYGTGIVGCNNAYGAWIQSGGPSVAVNNYGIKIDGVTTGTNKFALVADSGTVVFNDSAVATSDFRVESRTEANMIWLDANGNPSTAGLLYIGGNTNAVTIAKGGELTLIGTATVWDDLRVPMNSSKLGGSKDPGFAKLKDNGAGSQGVFIYWFDKSTEEELYFTVQLPHSWAATAITPHVHWVPASTDADTAHTVEWGLEYTWVNIAGTFGNSSIVYAKSAGTHVASVHEMTDFAAITPGAGTQDGISSMLVCRIFRNATDATDDTYDYDAGLLEIDFHYEINTMGSKTITAK